MSIRRIPSPRCEDQASSQISGKLSYSLLQTKKGGTGITENQRSHSCSVESPLALSPAICPSDSFIPATKISLVYLKFPYSELSAFGLLYPLTRNLFIEIHVSFLPSLLSKIYSKVAFSEATYLII